MITLILQYRDDKGQLTGHKGKFVCANGPECETALMQYHGKRNAERELGYAPQDLRVSPSELLEIA